MPARDAAGAAGRGRREKWDRGRGQGGGRGAAGGRGRGRGGVDEERERERGQARGRRPAPSSSALIEEGLRLQRAKACAAALAEEEARLREERQRACANLSTVVRAPAPAPRFWPPVSSCLNTASASAAPYMGAAALHQALGWRERGQFVGTRFPSQLRTLLTHLPLFRGSAAVVDTSWTRGSAISVVADPAGGAVICSAKAVALQGSVDVAPALIAHALLPQPGSIAAAAGITATGRLNVCALSRAGASVPRSTPCTVAMVSQGLSGVTADYLRVPYAGHVDFSTVCAFNKAGDEFLFSHAGGVHRLVLEVGCVLDHRFGRRAASDAEGRVGGEKAFLSALCVDDLLFAAAAESRTMFAGTRDGGVHHLDFRQPGAGAPVGEVRSLQARHMQFGVHQVNTLPGSGFSVAAADICNAISIFDMRRLGGGPLVKVQEGYAKGALLRAGFWASPHGDLLLSQWSESARRPVQLAFFDCRADFARIGDPAPLLLDGLPQFGTLQFARMAFRPDTVDTVGLPEAWASCSTLTEDGGEMTRVFALGAHPAWSRRRVL